METVRLNVVVYPPDPCVGQISFLNSNGALVGNALMNVNLGPGQATFLDLPGRTLVSKLGQRAELRPIVTPSSASDAPNSCVPSAEVYINGLQDYFRRQQRQRRGGRLKYVQTNGHEWEKRPEDFGPPLINRVDAGYAAAAGMKPSQPLICDRSSRES